MRTITKILLAAVVSLTAISAPVSAASAAQDVVCLAKNIYFEARGQPLAGKLAVAKVTLNRTKHEDFPDTVCKVVYQPGQFSWTTKRDHRINDHKAWKDSLAIASRALESGVQELRGFNAIYFHSGKRPPFWKGRLVAKIGGHKFYV